MEIKPPLAEQPRRRHRLLELEDIQSGVLRPRPSPYAATYLVFRIEARDGGRKLLERIRPVIASAAHLESPATDTW